MTIKSLTLNYVLYTKIEKKVKKIKKIKKKNHFEKKQYLSHSIIYIDLVSYNNVYYDVSWLGTFFE